MTTSINPGKANEELIACSTVKNEDTSELKLPLWKANAWFTVLWAMMLFDVIDRYALAASLPYIKSAFQLTDAQSGFLGTAFSFSIAVFVIPTAIVAHKWSRTKVCALMVAAWSLATWGTGLAKGYAALVAARFSVGVGEAGYMPVSYSLISAWYPKSKRGTMMGWFYAASQVGATVGLMFCGWLVYTYGWQASFGILCVPGLFLAVLSWFMPDFKNKVNEQVKEIEGEGTKSVLKLGVIDAFKYTLKSPAVLFSFFISGGYMCIGTALTIWGVTLFVRTFGMNVKQATTFIGFIAIIAAIGPVLLGWMADYLHKKNKKGRITASIIMSCGLMLAALLFTQNSLHAKNLVIAFITFGLCKSFMSSGIANINTLTQDLLPPYYRSVSSSFIPIANQIVGGCVGPVLCGALSDKFGLNMALGYVAAISFVFLMIMTLLCRMFYDRDNEKIERLGKFDLEKA